MQDRILDTLLTSIFELKRSPMDRMNSHFVDPNQTLTAQISNYKQRGIEYTPASYTDLQKAVEMIALDDFVICNLEPLKLLSDEGRTIYIVWNGSPFRQVDSSTLN